MKLHLYWLENIMNFTGPSQNNNFSRGSMLQPKALNFHYFILKVPCFLHVFGWPWMPTIILRDKSHHLFYHDTLKKNIFLILQITFVWDSKMLLLPQVQTVVTKFWDMNWCVQLLQIFATCTNTGKYDYIKHCSRWFRFTLQGWL